TFFETAQIRNGSVAGDGFGFEATVTIGGQNSVNVTFAGKVSGTQISGAATSPMGTKPFSGAKVP
ncbi:MAG TPA: hypothetical protein VK400_09345, partial [Pyrinomonadaceae bacterium]|nr:hypothetical protein [Pyrinomonadaceae bacterium]